MATRSAKTGGRTAPDSPTRTAGAASGPPQLQVPILRQLGMLLIFNILPVIGGLWLWWNYHTGAITFREPVGSHLIEVACVILICCMLISLSFWLVLPLAYWLRRYPTWHFVHVSKVVWALPMVFGWLASATIVLIALATSIVCLIVVITGLMHMLHVMG